MAFESKKIEVSELKDKSFTFKFGINLLKSRLSFDYDISKDEVNYSPKAGFEESGLTHSVRIDKFQITPNVKISKLIITVDYFNEKGRQPSKSERIETAESYILDGVKTLTGKYINESNQNTEDDGDKDEIEDDSRVEKGIISDTKITVDINNYSFEFIKEGNFSNLIQGKGNTIIFFITGEELVSSLVSSIASKINITVKSVKGEKRIPAMEAKEFLKLVFPKIKVELHPV